MRGWSCCLFESTALLETSRLCSWYGCGQCNDSIEEEALVAKGRPRCSFAHLAASVDREHRTGQSLHVPVSTLTRVPYSRLSNY